MVKFKDLLSVLWLIYNELQVSRVPVTAMLEIEVFCRKQEYATSYKNVVAKQTYPEANISDCVIAQLLPFLRFMTKHNSIWSKALIMSLTI